MKYASLRYKFMLALTTYRDHGDATGWSMEEWGVEECSGNEAPMKLMPLIDPCGLPYKYVQLWLCVHNTT